MKFLIVMLIVIVVVVVIVRLRKQFSKEIDRAKNIKRSNQEDM